MALGEGLTPEATPRLALGQDSRRSPPGRARIPARPSSSIPTSPVAARVGRGGAGVELAAGSARGPATAST